MGTIDSVCMLLDVEPAEILTFTKPIKEGNNNNDVRSKKTRCRRDNRLDMQILEDLINTQTMIVDMCDKKQNHSRDKYLLQALKEYKEIRKLED